MHRTSTTINLIVPMRSLVHSWDGLLNGDVYQVLPCVVWYRKRERERERERELRGDYCLLERAHTRGSVESIQTCTLMPYTNSEGI